VNEKLIIHLMLDVMSLLSGVIIMAVLNVIWRLFLGFTRNTIIITICC